MERVIKNNNRSLAQIMTHGAELPSKEEEQDFMSAQVQCLGASLESACC